MSDMTPNKRQELASAVILGHADAAELAEFKRLYAEDQSFQTLVAEMEEFLSPLSTMSEDADPPEGLLDDIMIQIAGPEASTKAAIPTPASEAPQRVRRRRSSNSRRHPERPWQYATAASLILAVGSLAVHSIPEVGTPEPAPVEVANVQEELLTLMTSGGEAPTVVVLLYDKDSNQITGRLTNVQPPSDGVWQLWLLRDGLDAPQSLGLLTELSDDGVINLSIATELAAGSDTLAISVEPRGGSPEAGPTGPVVFTGAVSPI